jgi:hypothetical protein
MTLDQQIRGALIANATLAAIVGNRVFSVVPADDVDAPFIVFQEVTAEPTPSFDDMGVTTVFLDYQFSCWGATPEAAKGIRRALAPVIAATFAQATAQSIGSSIQDPETRLHQSILQVSIPSSL